MSTDLVRCRLVGRITHADFLRDYECVNWGYGPRVGVPQRKLTPIQGTMQIPREDIEALAQQRHNTDRAKGVTDARIADTLAPLDCDRIGLAGELAAARFYGVTLQHDGPDPGFDFRWGDGSTCDVKASRTPHAHLYFDKLGDFKADHALLVVVESGL